MKCSALLSLTMLAAVLAGGMQTASAQTGVGVPVLVMADDEDRNSVIRTSDVHRRVLLELNRQFAGYDFYVISEDSLVARTGWEMRTRRPKSELLKIAGLACQYNDDTLCPRLVVIYQIRANVTDAGFATEIDVRLTGETRDVQRNSFMNGWEPARMEFAGPRKCESICLEEIIGDHARDIASSLGNVIAMQVAQVTRDGGGMDARAQPGSDPGLVNNYKFTFRDFGMIVISDITRVMESEFPEFVKVGNISGDGSVYVYNYVSRAPANKIYNWMNILLTDMGYTPAAFRVTLRNNREFVVERFGGPPPAKRDGSRFQ